MIDVFPQDSMPIIKNTWTIRCTELEFKKTGRIENKSILQEVDFAEIFSKRIFWR